jgi:hypothetical protein
LTVTEALEELAQWDARDIMSAADAKGIAAAFGVEPTVYPLADTYFDGEFFIVERYCQAGIMALDLLVSTLTGHKTPRGYT